MSKVAKFGLEMCRVGSVLGGPDFIRWLGLVILKFPVVLRTGSLGTVDDAFGSRVRFRCGERWLTIENGGLGVVREIAGAHCYVEPEELATARHILDLGANCGVFSLFALSSAPNAEVFAVEAQPPLAFAAQENVARNGWESRYRLINAYAGAKTDFINSLLARYPQIQAFDPQAYINQVGTCDFLKCDIEGAEFGLITPDAKWLRDVKRISLEYHGTWDDGTRLKSILEGHGFSVEQQSHGILGYLIGKRSS